MRYSTKPTQRPTIFRLNQSSPLYPRLVLAVLGQHTGSTYLRDDSGRLNHGQLAGYTAAQINSRWGWSTTLKRPTFNALSPATTAYAQSATLADATMFLGGGDLTICGWANYAFPAFNSGALYSTTDGGGNILALQVDGSSPAHLQLYKSVGYVSGSATTTGTLAASTWIHLGGVVSGGSSLATYLNGVADGTGTKSGAFGGTSSKYWTTKYDNTQYSDLLVWAANMAAYLPYVADPTNYDLRVGNTPLILPVRRYWPVAPVQSITNWPALLLGG